MVAISPLANITAASAIRTLVIIIVLVIIYRGFNMLNVNTYENYLQGIWVTDATFAQEAEVTNMMMYIDEPEDGWFSTTRLCYLIVDDVQQLITMNYRKGSSGAVIGEYKITPSLQPEPDDQLIWDCDKITIITDMRRGILTIYNEDVILAVMYKANDISDILK
ncbi:hypothetical protein PRJ_Fausto_00074 [Faustovirus]|nr:hypothetical protein PRJ_Fausto_00074 [Faustovirus]QBR98988.1 hypothetical protein [Faustovirus mariensis]